MSRSAFWFNMIQAFCIGWLLRAFIAWKAKQRGLSDLEWAELQVKALREDNAYHRRNRLRLVQDAEQERAERIAAEQEIQRLKAILREMESSDIDDTERACCPLCFFVRHADGSQYHDSQCLIGKALPQATTEPSTGAGSPE